MNELSVMLGFHHKNLTPYYPQANGQVEAIDKVLKTMLLRMVGEHRSNWNLTLFSWLWSYRNSVKAAIGFTPFQLVYGLEVVLPIECEIPSLKLVIELLPNTSTEEEHFLYLTNLDEIWWDDALTNDSHKKWIKAQYDKLVQVHVFNEGDFVLTYDQKQYK